VSAKWGMWDPYVNLAKMTMAKFIPKA